MSSSRTINISTSPPSQQDQTAAIARFHQSLPNEPVKLYNGCCLGLWSEVRALLPKATKKQLSFVNTLNGVSVLTVACQMNAPLDIVKSLIAKGLDVKARTSQGINVIDIAVQENASVELIEYLLSLGADVNSADAGGFTPLHIAAEYNKNIATIRTLISHGGDLNKLNGNGVSPLHLAVRFAPIEIVELFLQCGADPNVGKGGTALHAVVLTGATPEKAALLCEYGVDVSAKILGQTALEHAIRMRLLYLLPVLLNPPKPIKAQARTLRLVAPPSQSKCTYCEKTAVEGKHFPKCSGCHRAEYCGKECAKADWPVHKQNCDAGSSRRKEKEKASEASMSSFSATST